MQLTILIISLCFMISQQAENGNDKVKNENDLDCKTVKEFTMQILKEPSDFYSIMEESKSVDCKLYLKRIKDKENKFERSTIEEFLNNISLKNDVITNCTHTFLSGKINEPPKRKVISFTVKSKKDIAIFDFFINESKKDTIYELYSIELLSWLQKENQVK